MAGRNKGQRIAFVASDRPRGQAALKELVKMYGNCDPDDAEVIVALGGDGTLLDVLRAHMHHDIPVYGMNCGTVGFLMNEYNPAALPERIAKADRVVINPLRMIATDGRGKRHEAMAINEIALLRETRQTARITIKVHGQTRMETLICDGVLLSTPAGSTAYNLSAHGPILPISSNLLALTPISPFRPRRWRGALLSYDAEVDFEVQDPEFRTVLATADNYEVRDVKTVHGSIARDIEMCLLFDAGAGLEERILEEQFEY
ncbi:NAD kinase [Parvularcula marina]|uniref:NAD kinase n=1 Tax=Parvularcula marina TaxID=2292771 RepID=A0A371RKU9_9PROT|nr:NAD kinase [Parvularcula marina]RFB06087.1 NAD kinase [Parvularcula marina]